MNKNKLYSMVLLTGLLIHSSQVDANVINSYEAVNDSTVEDAILENITDLSIESRVKEMERDELLRLIKKNEELAAKTAKEELYSKEVKIDLSNVTVKSGISPERLEKILRRNGRVNMAKHAAAFVEAEHKYSVNALLLAAICVAESTDFKSEFSRDRFNPAGIGAYNSNPNNAKAFKSYDEAILYLGKLIGKDDKGRYVAGGRYSVEAIGKQYCQPSGPWISRVKAQMKKWVRMSKAVE